MSTPLGTLINNLTTHLSRIPNDIGFDARDYTQQESDEFRLAVIICHAELEVYFEDLAAEIITKSADKFFKNGQIDYCLANLMIRINRKGLQNIELVDNNGLKLNNYVNKSIEIFVKKVIEPNNGISTSKLYQIFRLIGMSSIFNPSTYGIIGDKFKYLSDLRAKFVHKKYTGKFVRTTITPNELKETISYIINNISDIDRKVEMISLTNLNELHTIDPEYYLDDSMTHFEVDET